MGASPPPKKIWNKIFLRGTGSQPRSAPEVTQEMNPEAGGAGSMPLAVTQEDCLVSYVFQVGGCQYFLFMFNEPK